MLKNAAHNLMQDVLLISPVVIATAYIATMSLATITIGNV
jgi:hypothetical protein